MRGALTLAIGHAGESALLNESPPGSPTSNAADALAALEGRSIGASARRSALGNADTSVSGSAEMEERKEEMQLPPSPEPPVYKLPPYPLVDKPVEADHEALRPVVVSDLDTT